MRKNGIVVAIDGPAGAGKSTTARLVAQALGYLYLDTGAMYRAVGLAVLRAGGDMEDADAVAALAREVRLNLKTADGRQWTMLGGEDVSEAIRTGRVAEAASQVARHQGVRDVLVARQQALGRHGGIVLEGRDTGSAIFPDAELKVFLVADAAERARRRQAELARRGETVALEALEAQIGARDALDQDTQRRFGPWPPVDAEQVDTTGLSVSEQVARVVELARARGA